MILVERNYSPFLVSSVKAWQPEVQVNMDMQQCFVGVDCWTCRDGSME